MELNFKQRDKPLTNKSFSISIEVWKDLDLRLKEYGYPNGVESINKSEMIEKLIKDFTEELEKDIKEFKSEDNN